MRADKEKLKVFDKNGMYLPMEKICKNNPKAEQMKAGAGIAEELKASDQMKWVGLMNNVRSSAEEIVIRELIYV